MSGPSLEERVAALEAWREESESWVRRTIPVAARHDIKPGYRKLEELTRVTQIGDCAESMKNVAGDTAESMANAPTAKLEVRGDHGRVTLADGRPVTADHREIDPRTGQQKDYVVLSVEERAKGFVRPVRRKYVHATCGVVTSMSQSIAETYARDPSFYQGTFCVGCGDHFPLDQFKWDGTDEQVGS